MSQPISSFQALGVLGHERAACPPWNPILPRPLGTPNGFPSDKGTMLLAQLLDPDQAPQVDQKH